MIWLHKHAGSGCDLNLSVVSSVVSNVGTDKLVCNKRKSVLSESVLDVLSFIESNSNSDQKKVCIKRASVLKMFYNILFMCFVY